MKRRTACSPSDGDGHRGGAADVGCHLDRIRFGELKTSCAFYASPHLKEKKGGGGRCGGDRLFHFCESEIWRKKREKNGCTKQTLPSVRR